MNRTTKDILIYSIITLIYGSLFVPLIVSTSLFFPYITGKAFTFRLFVELATLIYIVLALFDRSFLPRKGLILGSIVVFTGILGLATLHAEDPAKSFWSNFERMEGYVTILHLLCFFIVTTSVIRTKKAWYALLNTSLAISVFAGFRAFADYDTAQGSALIVEFFKGIKYFFVTLFGHSAQTIRISGTFGNSSYLGGYAMIHIFLSGLLFATLYKIKGFKGAPVRLSLYALAALFNLAVLYNTGTRGSFVGLVVGVFVAVLVSLCAVMFGKAGVSESAKKLTKKVSVIALVVIVAAIAFLGMNKNSDFIKKSDLMSRFSSLITFDVKSVLATQGEARTMLWGMSWKGVMERPVLGWGQDNFPYVFAKYYDPRMYAQEQWFDRTHNVFFDWLIAGGILGLLGYLSLFFALLYTLWKKTHLDEDNALYDIVEKSILTGLLAAYFVHNLFIFDNLISYILFFILLAYVNQRRFASPKHVMAEVGEIAQSLYRKIADKIAHRSNRLGAVIETNAGRTVVIVIAVIAFGYVADNAVVKPYMAGRTLIKALQVTGSDASKYFTADQTSPSAVLGLFQKAFGYNTFANAEIRERLAEAVPTVISANAAATSTEQQQAIRGLADLVTTQYAEAAKETPNDPRPFIFLSMYYQKLGAYDLALENIKKSVSLSPTKQTFLFQEGVIYFATQQPELALEAFKKAYDLDSSSPESRILYAVALIYSKDVDQAMQLISGDEKAMTDQRILDALLQTGQYDKILAIAQEKLKADPNNPQTHMSLAGLYLKMNRRADAIAEIRKVMAIAPQFKETGEYYIKEIQAGRDPSQAPAQQ